MVAQLYSQNFPYLVYHSLFVMPCGLVEKKGCKALTCRRIGLQWFFSLSHAMHGWTTTVQEQWEKWWIDRPTNQPIGIAKINGKKEKQKINKENNGKNIFYWICSASMSVVVVIYMYVCVCEWVCICFVFTIIWILSQ